MTRSLAGSVGRPRRPRATTSAAVGLLMLLVFAPIVTAAPVASAWSAKIGTGGVNGAATINVLTTGTGSIDLKLAKLRASTYHTVVVSKGTCSSAGTALIKFASLKTTAAGAATRTTSLSAAQVNLVKAATKGTGKIAIRIAYGSTVKCGVFSAAPVPPYVAAQVTVGRSPSGIAVDATGVWATNWWDNTLSRIDPATNTVLSVVPVDFSATEGPEAIGIGSGSLWVTSTAFDDSGNELPGVVKRIDPVSGTTLATIPVGSGAFDIDVSPGAVWVANASSGSVIRIDPATNQIVATLPILYASGVTSGLGAVWVVGGDGKVTRIDPATNQIVTTIPTQATGSYIATGNGAVWVTHPGDHDLSNGSLSRIDPATNTVVANTPLGSNPQEIVVAGLDIWVGMLGEPTVVRVSGTTNAVLNRVAVSSKVYAIAVGPGVVWAVHNLPTPTGADEPPAGVVSRISASAPIAAVTPAPSVAQPTVVGSSGRLSNLTSYRYIYGSTQRGTGGPLDGHWGESYGTVVRGTGMAFFSRDTPGQSASYGLIFVGDRGWRASDGVTFTELFGDDLSMTRITWVFAGSPGKIASGYEAFADLLAPAGTEVKNGVNCLRFHAAGPNPKLIPIGVPLDWAGTMDVWVASTGGYFVSARWDVVAPGGPTVGEHHMWMDITNVNDPTNVVKPPA